MRSFASNRENMSKGKVYLVGAGPGDVGLLTLKGLDCIRKAEVIIYDNLANPGFLSYAKKGAELIFAGKSGRGHTLSQEGINRLLVQKANQGKVVVRLKGGDPFLFARGAEEALALTKAGIPFEAVPGVTSALAVPAYAGIPLTHRNICSTLTIVTGHQDPLKKSSRIRWDRLLQKNTTLVILMGMGNLAKITKKLLAQAGTGKSSLPVAVIRNGTLATQEVLVGTLGDIADKVKKRGFQPPAVIIIGKVVNLRKKLNRFNKTAAKALVSDESLPRTTESHGCKPVVRGLPLSGKRILVTRPVGQAEEFIGLLKAQGAQTIKMPLIKIVPTKDLQKVDRVLSNIDNYNWVVFTSVNGVDCFLKRLKKKDGDIKKLKDVKFAAIGSRTALRLKSFGLEVELVPEQFRQESLGGEIIKRVEKGSRILLAQAQGSRDVLARMLKAGGLKVNTLPIYRTRPVTNYRSALREMFLKDRIDIVTLTSSSCVRAFVSLAKDNLRKYLKLKKVVIAVIGPVCRDTAKKLGLKVDIMSKEFTIEGLTQAIIDHYSLEGL